jgi:hypothetical protein
VQRQFRVSGNSDDFTITKREQGTTTYIPYYDFFCVGGFGFFLRERGVLTNTMFLQVGCQPESYEFKY